MTENATQPIDFFISRAGRDNAFAIWLAALLIAQGKTVILQDTDFKSRDFLDAMHEALQRCRRTVAIYSPDYLASDYCKAEWQAAIGDDIANAQIRFVPMMLEPCMPDGLLRRIAYKPLPDIRRRNDKRLLIEEILAWLDVPLVTLDVPEPPDGTLIARQPIVHPEIRAQDDFAGRGDLMAELAKRIDKGSMVLTNARHATQAISGLGGVGKTTLARQFAWLYQDAYEGVWWVRAEQRDTLLRDLVDLGGRLSPGIAQLALKDLDAAVAKTLEWIEATPSERPWLIVYDNVEGSSALDKLLPRRNAHVLVTTREPELRGISAVVDVDVFPADVATEFLMTRTGRKTDAHREAAGRLAAAVHFLPLALDHAGSYCTGAGMEFDAYRKHLGELLREKPMKGASAGRYPESVYGTFTLAIEKAAEGCPMAAKLMGIAAYLAPERLPLALIDERVMSVVERGKAVEALGAVSLVDRVELEEGGFALSVHRLVQVVMQARLAEQGEAEATAAEATRIVDRGYSAEGTFESIHTNARWLPHAVAVLAHAPEEGVAAHSTLWTYLQIGDMRVQLGELGVAMAAYESARDLAERLVAAEPDNTQWQFIASVSNIRFGNVLRAQGNLDGALNAFNSSQDILDWLAMAEPKNLHWQQTLSQSHCWIGMVLEAQGKLVEALEAYQAYKSSVERLAASDPNNAAWQRDLSVSYNNIGDVLIAQNNIAGALVVFKADLLIAERLAAAQVENTGRQRDLSVSHIKIGDVLRVQGNLSGSLAAFNTSLAIRDRLATADPSNAGWQQDVAHSLQRIGGVAVEEYDNESARTAYQRGLGIMQRLVVLAPDHAGFRHDLDWFEAKIAALASSQVGDEPVLPDAGQQEVPDPDGADHVRANMEGSEATSPPRRPRTSGPTEKSEREEPGSSPPSEGSRSRIASLHSASGNAPGEVCSSTSAQSGSGPLPEPSQPTDNGSDAASPPPPPALPPVEPPPPRPGGMRWKWSS